MSTTCPECGAVFPDNDTCQSVFESFLVLEFTDPRYGVIHFLTVACFMIQHGRYSVAGLPWIREKLRGCLEEGWTNEQLRREAGKDAGNEERTWKVNRRPGDPPAPAVAWSLTIADVALNYEGPESYVEWIKRWARATLAEMVVN